MTLQDLPALNAGLNGTCAALLALGYVLVRSGRPRAHAACMLAAVATSTLFLTSYVYYHFHVGSVRFPHTGPIRTVYFSILISHTVLAVVIVPLVLATLVRAVRRRFEAHRRLARLTLPVWAYVSVTGVAIYWMLYRL